MVSFTVKDEHGRYVAGLKSSDIRIREDGVEQRIESFSDAAAPAGSTEGNPSRPALAGAGVFFLFDTSNCMYDGFSRAEDAIASFIRKLHPRQPVAVYSFSHNLTRLARLTADHEQAIRGLRNAIAGDDTSLLNAILLTLRDAAQVPGRKAVIVFSNGPDNASMVTPGDVARVAEEQGVPVYIISTKPANEICQRAFHLLAASTGGEFFEASVWSQQVEALRTIDNDLKHTYTLTYYPLGNKEPGWRSIDVQVIGDEGRRYQIKARKGYISERRAVD